MEEEKLIAKVLRGDNNCFTPLISRYGGMVYSVCVRILNNRTDAEETAHDTFVEAFIKLGQLQNHSKFGGWLRAIAVNLCCCKLKSDKLNDEIPDDFAAPQIMNDFQDSISQSLPLLTAPHRLILALHYMAGLDYDEISKFLDIPTGTVMSRLHRARQMAQKNINANNISGEEEMIAEEQFTNEVMAEISVLMPLIDGNKTVKERLSIVLRRSPDILIRMLNEDDAYLNNLAILLPRLGMNAVENVAALALAGNNRACGRATLLLTKSTALLKCGAEMGWQNNMPPGIIYTVIHRVIRDAAPAEIKASLLIELLKSQTDDDVNALISCAIMSYRDAAFPLLMLEYYRLALSGGAYMPVLTTLCRYGETFANAVATMLRSDCGADNEIGLIAAEALSKSLNSEISGTEKMQQVRINSKWVPVIFNAEKLADAASPYLLSVVQENRIAAIKILTQLKSGTNEIAALMNDENTAVKRTAIAAMAELNHTDAIPEIISMLKENNSVAEASIAALARIKAVAAVPELMNIVNTSKELFLPAITALAEIDMQTARPVLTRMMKDCDGKKVKIAAKLLYRKETVPREKSALEIERLRRLRGDKIPVSYKATDAAIRFALSENRDYDEKEITSLIAGICEDYSGTRRQLIETNLMTRRDGIYKYTVMGEVVRYTEEFIYRNYLSK